MKNKKIYLFSLLSILLFNLNFLFADTDSLYFCNDSCLTTLVETKNNIDTCSAYETIDIKATVKKAKQTLHKTKAAHTKNNITNKAKPSGFFDWIADAWEFLSKLTKPVWGHYEEESFRSEGPYFTFDRSIDGNTYLRIQMDLLRNKIKVIGSKERELYRQVFDSARTDVIDNCNGVWVPNPWDDGNEVCKAAFRAKISAFVYLVGLNASGDTLTTTARNGYRDRALAYLRDVKEQGLNNAFDYLSWTPGSFITNPIAATTNWKQYIWRCKELQQICQAWDMLRWCYNIDPALPNDGLIRSRLNEAANRIIDYYVVPLHRRAQSGLYYAHNNFTLVAGAALASAAICFHDYGTYVWLFETRPERWANSAYYNIHNTMWRNGLFATKKMSMPGNTYGYAEGTHYFMFAFENLIPMFLARNNFSPADKTNPYNSFTFDPDPYYVRNFWHDPDYDNLYKWYSNLIQPDGTHPTIDDSYSGAEFNTAMAILRKSGSRQYNYLENAGQLRALQVDYLAALTPPVRNYTHPNSVQMASGDIVIRSRPIDEQAEKGKHYIHINAEKESAKEGGWHEQDGDFGSFIIAADKDLLMIDPPLFKDGESEINQAKDHNTLDALNLKNGTISSPLNDNGSLAKITLKVSDPTKGIWNRTFLVNREDPILGYHYIVTDEVKPSTYMKFSFNYNGNGEQTTHNIPSDSNYIDWTYPCVVDTASHWGIRAHFSTSMPSVKSVAAINDAKHGSVNANICYQLLKSDHIHPEAFRHHTRYTVNITTGSPFSLQTVLQPRKCANFNSLGKTFTRNTNNYGLSLIYLDDSSKARMAYVSKHDNDLDTIINPLQIDSNSVLRTNANITYFYYGLDSVQQFGWCTSYSRFRTASLHNGDTLIYNDTNYIIATKPSDIYYKLIGKYRYEGYVNSDSGTSVKFYLPDLERGIAMKITSTNGKLVSNVVYNDSTYVINGLFDAGYTSFVIELADPCLYSCFFPPTQTNIVDTFDFTSGGIERLGHDLDIVPDSGWLNMTNGSKISICSGTVLTNRDSITMVGAENGNGGVDPTLISPTTGGFYGENYSLLGASKVSVTNAITGDMANGSRRCMIIVNDLAALVLDSGSRTHIGANSTILVKKGGTLFIKKGAFVEIGSQDFEGRNDCFGEILAEDSAFVCIEDSSDIHFYVNTNDSVDKNRFFITTLDSFPTIAGVNTNGIKGKFNSHDTYGELGRFRNHNCISFCSLKTSMPPDGINNRPFGWSNISRPHALFDVLDTFCIGDTGYIYNAEKTLNEVDYAIIVQRVILSGADTLVQDEHAFRSATGSIKRLNNRELFLPSYHFDSAGLYMVKVKVDNSCNEQDQLIKRFYVRRKPQPAIVKYSDTICAGQGSLTVSDTTVEEYPRYETKWHAHVIDTANNILKQVSYGKDWSYGVKQSTFDFPDFFWYGGFKYAISLSITNECGTSTTWDTIVVKPGAYIELSKPTVYGEPISGVTQIQLTAHTPLATSFAWSPGTWLNRTDSSVVISSPTDSITYILTATNGACTTSDTVHINYNRYANAGLNDTLCYDSTHTPEVLLGFPYDMSLFLGIMYYYDRSNPHVLTICDIEPTAAFRNSFSTHNNMDHLDYFRYFTHFMHTEAFKNKATECTNNLYQLFTSTINKDIFFRQAWYKQYYKDFTSFSDGSLTFLDDFVTAVDADNDLIVAIHDIDYWCNINPCFDNLLTEYDYFLANNMSDITASWSKVVAGDTTFMGAWNNFFVAVDTPIVSTKYILTVITPSYAEIDETTILLDTILSPFFVPVMQFDSTVYFSNLTQPTSSTISYEWHFNDGSGNSTEFNPVHTFPAFDSSYRVCLYATNECNTFMYCDTVWIDSLHQGSILLSKPESKPLTADGETNNAANKIRSSVSEEALNKLNNYPNPFNSSTVIEYEIWQPFKQAELRITNVLGQQIFTQKITKPIDKIWIDGSVLADGIYYYSLITDGAVKQTKTMSVMH
ncbi:MAG: T9SS type A sorting domain-containing protein [Bacteroidota bacterium]